MARRIRNSKLDTRTARAKLPARREPYWVAIAPGRHLGYRRLGPKGGTWIARRSENGQRAYRALGTADDVLDANGRDALDFVQAQELARAWFGGELDKPEILAAAAPATVGAALDDYLSWVEKNRKTPRETRWAIDAHIRPALGNVPLSDLTAERIAAWHEALAAAPARVRSKIGKAQRYKPGPADRDAVRARRSTANRVLTILKAALNRAFRKGLAASDEAWRRVRPFEKADAARVRWLKHDECLRLLNTCPPDLRRLARAALLTGCRYSELARLEARDFDEDAGTLHIRETKGGTPRHVHLTDEGIELLRSLTAGRGGKERVLRRDAGEGAQVWGRNHQARPLREACTRARIEPAIGFHVLRHTFASHMVMAGAPLLVVAQALGHADTRMVEKHYGHLAPSYLRETIRSKALRLGDGEPTNVTAFLTEAEPRAAARAQPRVAAVPLAKMASRRRQT